MFQTRRGRTFDDVWELFTEAVAPNREQAAVCKHCKERIVYWRKSESSERNFSTTGFIHSKLRSSLKEEKVMKQTRLSLEKAPLLTSQVTAIARLIQKQPIARKTNQVDKYK
jgi:transcriptional regulator NrdR family protein